MTPLLWKLLAGAGLLLAIAGGSFYAGHHMEAKVFADYKDQQTAVAATQVAHNQTAVAAITASEAQGLQAIATTAQESRNEIQKRNDALVAANTVLAGQLQRRLASPGRPAVVVPPAATGGSVADADSQAALPDGLEQLVEFNTRQFRLADEGTVTITALQAIVAQDRQVCNGSLPGVAP